MWTATSVFPISGAYSYFKTKEGRLMLSGPKRAGRRSAESLSLPSERGVPSQTVTFPLSGSFLMQIGTELSPVRSLHASKGKVYWKASGFAKNSFAPPNSPRRNRESVTLKRVSRVIPGAHSLPRRGEPSGERENQERRGRESNP
jgi:hypothetical protein